MIPSRDGMQATCTCGGIVMNVFSAGRKRAKCERCGKLYQGSIESAGRLPSR